MHSYSRSSYTTLLRTQKLSHNAAIMACTSSSAQCVALILTCVLSLQIWTPSFANIDTCWWTQLLRTALEQHLDCIASSPVAVTVRIALQEARLKERVQLPSVYQCKTSATATHSILLGIYRCCLCHPHGDASQRCCWCCVCHAGKTDSCCMFCSQSIVARSKTYRQALNLEACRKFLTVAVRVICPFCLQVLQACLMVPGQCMLILTADRDHHLLSSQFVVRISMHDGMCASC